MKWRLRWSVFFLQGSWFAVLSRFCARSALVVATRVRQRNDRYANVADALSFPNISQHRGQGEGAAFENPVPRN